LANDWAYFSDLFVNPAKATNAAVGDQSYQNYIIMGLVIILGLLIMFLLVNSWIRRNIG
jgi:hypothetical protein